MVLTGIVVFNMSMLIIVVATGNVNETNEKKDLQLSDVKNVWTNTPRYCHMADFDNFSADTLSILKDILPVAENVWINARAKPTPYFIFRSCYTRNNDLQDLQNKTFRDNCVSKCLAYCQDYEFFGLMEDQCICFNNSKGLTAELKLHCCLRCPGNLNDCCGNNGTVMAVYDFNGVTEWVEPDIAIDRRCAVVNNTVNQTFVRKCSDEYGVKCSGVTVNQTELSWSKALNHCRDHRKFIDHEVTHYQDLASAVYVWTPLQRSSQLHWLSNKNASDFPWCISIRKNKDNRLSLHEEYCDTNLRHCVVCEPARVESNTDIPIWTINMMFAVLAIISIGIILLSGFAISTCRKRKSKSKTITGANAVQNVIYEADVSSSGSTNTSIPTVANVNRPIHNTPAEADIDSSVYSYADLRILNTATKRMSTNEKTQKNNGAALTNYYINTAAEFPSNHEDQNMYDSTSTVFKEKWQKEATFNVYAHARENWENENVYDNTNTNIKADMHNDHMYDHAKALVKDNNQS